MNSNQNSIVSIKQIFPRDQLLAYFKISKAVLRSWEDRGLPVIRIGLSKFFAEDDLVSFLLRHKVRKSSVTSQPDDETARDQREIVQDHYEFEGSSGEVDQNH